MKIFTTLLFFWSVSIAAQTTVSLTPTGFSPNPVTENIPLMSNEKFMDITRLWIEEFTRGTGTVSELTTNSLTLDAYRDNAFYITNLGETFYYKVRYQLKIAKEGNTYSATFNVTQIQNTRSVLESSITNYFLPDGTMKEGFEEVKPSMEKTANIILGSYYRYINRN
ncbi:hypothetical protein GV828_12550 [Flavobacterium sp. NST-5]|uniref:DUF4468 domain-containing protein n=1 Tax=Flavobacterium ichthyis TaxID=2698827 RepID=A0ABW9ZG06_9FLAO|nr:hypothetical protein [Flavobacterium ichthyis]NBL66030.1 hypothetical protein [Flavobacterium ichthyis]